MEIVDRVSEISDQGAIEKRIEPQIFADSSQITICQRIFPLFVICVHLRKSAAQNWQLSEVFDEHDVAVDRVLLGVQNMTTVR